MHNMGFSAMLAAEYNGWINDFCLDLICIDGLIFD